MPVPQFRERRAPIRRRGRQGRPADVLGPSLRPPRAVVRSAGTWTLQSVLQRHGLGPVAGVDEAGRGASAGPLVVAACVLRAADTKALDGLTDSKLLSPAAREEYYARIRRRAVDQCVVVIGPDEVDRRGVHVANIEGMRRAVAGLADPPGYVLTDGFPVRGFGRPTLAVPKGDRVAACVAAASVLAKVTRDRLMVELDGVRPGYGFAVHKGYCTPEHDAALTALGPCPDHRYSFANVAAVAGRGPLGGLVHNGEAPDEVSGSGAASSGDADDDPWAEPGWDGWEPGAAEPMDVVMGGPAS